MGINRKELEEKTFQWFNSSISDKDYNSPLFLYLVKMFQFHLLNHLQVTC